MYFDKDCALDYRTQYKQLILKHHPDKGGDAATFRAIQGEYKSILFFHNRDPKADSWADLMEKEENIDLDIRALTNDILQRKS